MTVTVSGALQNDINKTKEFPWLIFSVSPSGVVISLSTLSIYQSMLDDIQSALNCMSMMCSIRRNYLSMINEGVVATSY